MILPVVAREDLAEAGVQNIFGTASSTHLPFTNALQQAAGQPRNEAKGVRRGGKKLKRGDRQPCESCMA